MENNYLTVCEVASLLRVHERTVRRWISNGSLKVYRFGDSERAPIRISPRAVDEFMGMCNSA